MCAQGQSLAVPTCASLRGCAAAMWGAQVVAAPLQKALHLCLTILPLHSAERDGCQQAMLSGAFSDQGGPGASSFPGSSEHDLVRQHHNTGSKSKRRHMHLSWNALSACCCSLSLLPVRTSCFSACKKMLAMLPTDRSSKEFHSVAAFWLPAAFHLSCAHQHVADTCSLQSKRCTLSDARPTRSLRVQLDREKSQPNVGIINLLRPAE